MIVIEHDTLLDADGKPLATWKETKESQKFDADRFKAENPDLYKQYLKPPTTQRRFLLKIKED